jgi:hypothetical protein
MTKAQKAEQKRLKAIPNKGMKEAITDLNTFLKAQEMDEIKLEKSKGLTVAGFEKAVGGLIEAGKATEIPEAVATFYNEHIVGDTGEADPEKKDAKKSKPKKDAKPKKPSNEQAAYDMVAAGKGDKAILTHFTKVYEGKGKDDDFIAKRAAIYTKIAKRKWAKENPAPKEEEKKDKKASK